MFAVGNHRRPRRNAAAIPVILAAALLAPGLLAADPEADGVGTPEWAKEELPEQYRPFVARAGLPTPWQAKIKKGPLGSAVAGIDRYHANHFVVYRPETAGFLYTEYTPTTVNYRPGSLPGYEKLAAEHTAGLSSPKEKAVALVRAMPQILKHPTMPPCGPGVRADRGLLDEPLLASGGGFCNEQARVFVRLCQVLNIPARLVFLFYADHRTGHTIAEFYADGRWSMADTSWFCVFPADAGAADGAADGRLLSAAEAHDGGPNHARVQAVYRTRFEELLRMTDEQLGRADGEPRKGLEEKLRTPDALGVFGLMNYPLPPGK